MKVKIHKIKIKVGKKTLTLSLDDAYELLDRLSDMLELRDGDSEKETVPRCTPARWYTTSDATNCYKTFASDIDPFGAKS